jgi:membrane fusion protein, multidrug efflux system
MNTTTQNNGEKQFANGQSAGDSRINPLPIDAHAELNTDAGQAHADHPTRLDALQQDSGRDRVRIDFAHRIEGASTGGGNRFRFSRTARKLLLGGLLVLALGVVSPFVWNYLQSYQATDDAEIDGHIDPLSSRIDGTVIRVHAEDDDRVRKGDLLVEIDPRDNDVAVEQAQARLELALAQVASAKQDYASAMAMVRETDAANFKSQRDAARYAILLNQQVVAQEQYDQYTATARVDSAKVDSAREAAGSVLKAIAARQADADAARAALDQALLNLSYTKIYAPANGIVGKRTVERGSRIEPGQTLMYVTETDDIWVTADFKETQLARMQPGQQVTIRVDTFGKNYRGYVENLPGASGDRFSLLPPENATGNYVKVVQRLPVRIVFAPGQDPDHLLHPGMSVEPKVWLR